MANLPFSDPNLEAVIEGILERHGRENPITGGLERYEIRMAIDDKGVSMTEAQDALDSLVAIGKITSDGEAHPRYKKAVQSCPGSKS